MNVEALRTADGVRTYLDNARPAGKPVGLVPTMGALHAGHGSLIDLARSECGTVVVSLFVNALQFGPNEDLGDYPRRFEQDVLFCDKRGVDALFAPSDEEMYPGGAPELVEVGTEAEGLCGASRPGHFRGVATAVLKLFDIVHPDRAYFGEKDIQQLAVISRMTRERDLSIDIVAGPTERELDGLAISSRNEYLGPEERQIAPVLYRALRVARQRIGDGDLDPAVARKAARQVLALEPTVRVDYVEIVNPVDMQPVEEIQGPVRAVAAIWIGDTRLIDNTVCEPSKRVRRRRK